MTKTFSVTLSDAEVKALAYVTFDPQEWIENAVKNRASIAMEELLQDELKRVTQEGGSLSGTPEEIVLNSTLPSGYEREMKFREEISTLSK